MKGITRFLKKASSINDHLSSFLALVGGIIIVLMMVAIAYASISRYFFGKAIASITELSSYSLLFITFLGGPLLARKNGHVSVDILPSILGKRGKMVIKVFASLVSFIVTLLLAWFGLKSTINAYHTHEIVVDILRTPKYLLLAMITLGCFLMSISFLTNALVHESQSNDEQQ